MPKSTYPSMFPPISMVNPLPVATRYPNGFSFLQKSVECIEYQVRPAQVAFVHNGMPHQMPICCQQCAQLVQQRGYNRKEGNALSVASSLNELWTEAAEDIIKFKLLQLIKFCS